MGPSSPEPPRRRSGLEVVLSVVTEVRPGEGVTALLMTLNLFLLLLAYYVIKPVREALILALESGAELKSYMGGAIALALLVAVPAYSAFANRVARNRLVVGVTLFFVANLVLFYLASLSPQLRGNLGLVFYGWVGIFNMMAVAQVWAFTNDVYTEEQGKRLFALVGLGASLGATLGGIIPALLVETLGVYQMFLVSAGLLLLTAVLTQVIHVRALAESARGAASETEDAADPREDEPDQPEESARSETGPDRSGAFALVLRHRYLGLLAAFSLVFTLVNSNGEYMLGQLASTSTEKQAKAAVTEEDARRFLQSGGDAEARIEAEITSESDGYAGLEPAAAELRAARAILVEERQKELIGAFFGTFYSGVNILSLLLQAFLVSRLVKYLGLARAFFILPFIAFLDAAAVAIWPVLLVLRIGKTAENAFDYSLNNTLRNMLWLPTTREMKYKAKQAVDTFFVRMGDVSSALVVFVLAGQLALGVRWFAVTNLVLVTVWLLLAWMIGREYHRQHRLRAGGA